MSSFKILKTLPDLSFLPRLKYNDCFIEISHNYRSQYYLQPHFFGIFWNRKLQIWNFGEKKQESYSSATLGVSESLASFLIFSKMAKGGVHLLGIHFIPNLPVTSNVRVAISFPWRGARIATITWGTKASMDAGPKCKAQANPWRAQIMWVYWQWTWR